MWLSKPLYESLPYYYIGIGVLALMASVYVDYWYWPHIGVAVGIASLIAGLVVWLRRRDYRHSRSRSRVEDQP